MGKKLIKMQKKKKISLSKVQAEETTVLFVFLYNMIVLHAYIEIEAFPTCLWDWRYLERAAYYTIGGVAYSIWDIHHGLLRHNRPAPYGLDVPFYDSDPRKNLQKNIIYDPAIIFTLCNHTKHVFGFFHFSSILPTPSFSPSLHTSPPLLPSFSPSHHTSLLSLLSLLLHFSISPSPTLPFASPPPSCPLPFFVLFFSASLLPIPPFYSPLLFTLFAPLSSRFLFPFSPFPRRVFFKKLLRFCWTPLVH